MADPLKCLHCGCRRMIRTEVLDQDGNPFEEPWLDIFKCAACDRAFKIGPSGQEPVVSHSSGAIVAWRGL